jgi:hypothetical protein
LDFLDLFLGDLFFLSFFLVFPPNNEVNKVAASPPFVFGAGTRLLVFKKPNGLRVMINLLSVYST